jgi:hypothetical protein
MCVAWPHASKPPSPRLQQTESQESDPEQKTGHQSDQAISLQNRQSTLQNWESG